jgi:nucleoside-diphosphate-sugar epimerase
MKCLTDVRTHGATFNLGSGRDHSVTDILREIQDLLGTSLEPIHRADIPGEAQRTCADVSSARALGWEPQVPLREGLQHSIDYIRQHVLDDAAVEIRA